MSGGRKHTRGFGSSGFPGRPRRARPRNGAFFRYFLLASRITFGLALPLCPLESPPPSFHLSYPIPSNGSRPQRLRHSKYFVAITFATGALQSKAIKMSRGIPLAIFRWPSRSFSCNHRVRETLHRLSSLRAPLPSLSRIGPGAFYLVTLRRAG